MNEFDQEFTMQDGSLAPGEQSPKLIDGTSDNHDTQRSFSVNNEDAIQDKYSLHSTASSTLFNQLDSPAKPPTFPAANKNISPLDAQRFAPSGENTYISDHADHSIEKSTYPITPNFGKFTSGIKDRFAPPEKEEISSSDKSQTIAQVNPSIVETGDHSEFLSPDTTVDTSQPNDVHANPRIRKNNRRDKDFSRNDTDTFATIPSISQASWWTAEKSSSQSIPSEEKFSVYHRQASTQHKELSAYHVGLEKPTGSFTSPTDLHEKTFVESIDENPIRDKKFHTKLKKTMKVNSTPAYAESTHKSFFHFISYNIRHARLSYSLLSKVILINLSVIVLVYLGLIWNWKTHVDQSFQTVDALTLNADSIRNRSAQAGDQTFLIVGVDSRSGANAELGGGNSDDISGARSDTIILVDIPANRKRVIAISFPRDLQVDRPDCKQWDNNSGTYSSDIVPGEQYSKINAAYAFGGPKCLVTVIQNISGIEINHFVAMDFEGFVHLVNDVGGVEVCNTVPLIDDELGTILARPGKHLINGNTALRYVRARMVDTENNGDYGRIRRQQHFISSLLRSMLSTRVLSNPTRLNTLIRDFTEVTYVQNITTGTLLDLAQSIKQINAGHVTMLTIPTVGTSTDGKNNEIPNIPAMDTIFDDIIDDIPLPGEPGYDASSTNDSDSNSDNPNTTSSTSNSPQRQKIVRDYTFLAPGTDTTPIHLINDGNSIVQLQLIASALNNLGYNSTDLEDGDRNLEHTIVQYALGERNIAAEIASLFPHASIQANPKVAGRIDIMVGKDATNLPDNLPSVGTQLSVHQIPSVLNRLPSNISFTNGADSSCL